MAFSKVGMASTLRADIASPVPPHLLTYQKPEFREGPPYMQFHTHSLFIHCLRTPKGGHSLSCLSAYHLVCLTGSLHSVFLIVHIPCKLLGDSFSSLNHLCAYKGNSITLLVEACLSETSVNVKILKIVIRLGFWEGHITITMGIWKNDDFFNVCIQKMCF